MDSEGYKNKIVEDYHNAIGLNLIGFYMNKSFFKIKNKIKLIDILKLLKVSEEDFLNINKNINVSFKKLYIYDFVSFVNLKKNKLTFFTNKKKFLQNLVSGVCIVENGHFLS